MRIIIFSKGNLYGFGRSTAESRRNLMAALELERFSREFQEAITALKQEGSR